MKKKLRTVLLMLIMVTLATISASAASIPADIAGTSCEKAVKTLIEAGAITGDTDGLFHPENNLTRAQACVIIVKTIDPIASLVNGTATQSVKKTNFSDLIGYSWAAGYIGYAVEYGIVKGYSDGTFKPGENVTTDEIITMMLRAVGYTDEQIGTNWPADYISKAKEVGIFENIKETYPVNATKGMAAQMAYNQMKELKAMAPVQEEAPQGTNKDEASSIPSTKNMTFVTGSFDSDLTSFAGKMLSNKVTVYTYGAKADYNKDMTFSNKTDDYILDTIYKYNSTMTPALYLFENGEITSMILPRDLGFTGNAYSVINGKVTVTNIDNQAVIGIQTLTATKKITWLGKKGLAVPSLTNGDGQLYEIHLSDGEAQSVCTNLTGYKGKTFNELTTSNSWTKVMKFDDGVITDINGKLIGTKNNASIYVWDDENAEYRSGSLSSLKAGKYVRAYDVSSDDVTQADVVIVKE